MPCRTRCTYLLVQEVVHQHTFSVNAPIFISKILVCIPNNRAKIYNFRKADFPKHYVILWTDWTFIESSNVITVAIQNFYDIRFVENTFQYIKCILVNILCARVSILSKIWKNVSIAKTYPDIWKIGKVSPKFKIGDKTNLENYRCVILQNNFCKLV